MAVVLVRLDQSALPRRRKLLANGPTRVAAAGERRAFRRADRIAVEVADAARFADVRAAWADLATRACEPNPFMDPDLIAAAAAGDDRAQVPVLLAWHRQRLVGAWAFAVAQPLSRLPVQVLAAPVRGLLPNGMPVIDRDLVEPVLGAMLDAIARSPALPKLLSIAMLNDGGPLIAGLRTVLDARGSPPVVLWRGTRPMLDCKTTPADYFARTMSGSRRRKLGQLRRRLSTRGDVTLAVHRGHDAAAAVERFIRLEASGWKAKSGASERERVRYRDFLRTAVTALADHGGVEIWEMSLVGAAISMALFLRHLSGVYDWKIAYDERQRDCSPGVLLAQDYTAAYLDDPTVTFGDSCASTDTGVLGSLWDGRQPMVSLIFDARVGGSRTFSLWSRCELAGRRLHSAVRAAYRALRGHRQAQAAAGTATAEG